MVTSHGGSRGQQAELLQHERRPAFLSRAQLVERILELNPTATTEFLSRFTEGALAHYLEHLNVLEDPGIPWVRKGIAPAIVRREPRE
ncbi:MAG TPA: hypothetical protein VD997_03250 [Phycisphaerales bacterium]|nr:hypothetical protein [Phycisphaerales bacterium]